MNAVILVGQKNQPTSVPADFSGNDENMNEKWVEWLGRRARGGKGTFGAGNGQLEGINRRRWIANHYTLPLASGG